MHNEAETISNMDIFVHILSSRRKMNEIINNILTRRSVRAFADKKVAREDIEVILNTAIYAPTGMNKQTWQFTALTKKEDIEELAGLVEKLLDRPGYNFYKPNVLIITSNDRDSKWAVEDNACALENMFLAAHSLGLGTVWINQLQTIGDNEEVREFLTRIGVPENHLVYGTCALGYPAANSTKEPVKTGVIKIVD